MTQHLAPSIATAVGLPDAFVRPGPHPRIPSPASPAASLEKAGRTSPGSTWGTVTDKSNFKSDEPRKPDFIVFLMNEDLGWSSVLSGILKAHGYEVRQHSRTRPFPAEPSSPIEHRPAARCRAVDEISRPAGAGDAPNSRGSSQPLFAAITVARGRDMEATELRDQLASATRRLARLTGREWDVLNGVIAGLLNKQIAAQLMIAEKTVKLHRGRMMKKMETRSVAELVRITERAGIRPATQGSLLAGIQARGL